MKLSAAQRQDILVKQAKLESIKPILKSEFMGIDHVIDQVIDSLRPFYIFPKSLKRPLIVNLWGMTGTGKTSLVIRIVELLELTHQFCRFDIGEYVSESSDWKLRKDLQSKTDQCRNKNLVVMFDEFQLGRTIAENGMEIDRVSLRPLWDIIDSGVISTWNSSGYEAIRILMRFEKAIELGVSVENGIIVQGYSEFESLMADMSPYLYLCDFNKKDPDIAKNHPHGYIYKHEDSALLEDPHFIKREHFNTLYALKPELFDNIQNYERWWNKFRVGQTGHSICEWIEQHFVKGISMMKKEDFSQSLIFCLGNIDEAYVMAHSSDPDADADLFYDHSLKITIPKMKNALARRFRMEQIGRLGNNHIIYPSFSRDTYTKIIDLGLTARVNTFRDDFGIRLMFDDSVNDIIYKEGVFPTQGARPVLSTLSTLIDAYVAQMISDMVLHFPETTQVKWKFSDGDNPKFDIVAINGSSKKKKAFSYPVKLTLENLRKSDHSESQATVAVHEAGHAVVAVMKLKLVPKEVKSRTASVAEGVCYTKLPKITTRQSLYNDIVMCLGGLEAEKLIFGQDTMSAGGSSDLQRVTSTATAMIKTYGMGDEMHQIAVPNPMSSHNIYDSGSNKDAETAAITIVRQAQADARRCLEDNLTFLLELSAHLAKHPNINEDDLAAMASKYTTDIKDQENYYGFRERLLDQTNQIMVPIVGESASLNSDEE